MSGTPDVMTPDSLDHTDQGGQADGPEGRASGDPDTGGTALGANIEYDQEQVNYSRLCQLFSELAPQAIRQVFNSIYPPISLVETLAQPTVTVNLRRLRAMGLLTAGDWDVLYPHRKSQVSSAHYDPSLLYLLLRNLSPLTAPYPGGWHGLPHDSDLSLAADLVRIQWYRTLLVHRRRDTDSRLSEKDFKGHWQKLRGILERVGGTGVKLKVDRMEREQQGSKSQKVDKDQMKILQSWDEKARELAAKEAQLEKNKSKDRNELSQLTSDSLSEYTQGSGADPHRKSGRLSSDRQNSGSPTSKQRSSQKDVPRRRSHHITKEVNTLTKAELLAHERSVLLKFYRQLTEVVQSDDVIPKLIQRSLMSHEEKNRINLATHNADRMKMVLEHLSKKSGNTFDKFCDVIKYKYKKLSDQMMKAKQSPLKVEKPDEKTQCRTALGVAYKSLLQTVSPIPWHPEVGVPLNDFLLPYHITDFYGRAVAVEHLFAQHPKCERPRRILLEGLDGVGKSSLLRQLAYLWTQGPGKGHFLGRYKLVLLLDLQRVTGSLMDTLTEQCLGPGGYIRSASELHALLSDDQENILFLLDGYEDINNIESDIWELVHRELYPKSSLILASNTRFVTSGLLKHFDTQLVLLGIEPDTQEDLIRRYSDFTNTPIESYAGLLTKVISEYNTMVRTLTLNPLYALCMCLVSELGGSLDFHTLSYMMTSVVWSLQKLHCQKDSVTITEDSVPDDIKEAVGLLEKVALDRLLENKGQVTQRELADIAEGKSDSIMQILTSSRLLRLVDDGSVAGLHGDKTYKFIHRIFQEFLAARHLSHKEPEDFSEYVDSLVNERHLHKVAAFYCGIHRYDYNLRTLRELFKLLADSNTRLLSRRSTRDTMYSATSGKDSILRRTEGRLSSMSHSLECLAEVEGRKDLMELVQENYPWRLYMKHRVHHSPATIIGLGQVLKSNMAAVSELELRLDHVGLYYEHFYMSLADAIEKNTHLVTLKIRWTREDLLAVFLANVFGENKSLQHLHITDESKSAQDDISATVWSNLWTAGNNMQHLKTLAFTHCKNPAIVTSFIRNSPQFLNNFYLNSCKLDLISAQELSNKIEKSRDLRLLNLAATKLKRSDFLYIAYGLKLNKSITELILHEVQLDETSALALAEALELNTTLKRLDLQKVDLTVESCRALGHALAVNQSLLEVDLRKASVPEQGARLLYKLKRDSVLLTGLDHKKLFGITYSMEDTSVSSTGRLPAIKT